MKDPLSKAERSALMAKVRSMGNRSTELVVETVLRTTKIRGWKKHPKAIVGRPDFYFPKAKLAVFVDGCFWHACPRCGRIPKTRIAFWTTKIDTNRRRDARVRRKLRLAGIATMRIWEHEALGGRWMRRLQRRLARLTNA
jgi:DNA mismatch endonuclease (patch repair protein)